MNKIRLSRIGSTFRFRKFSRKNYAAFSSMHKEVTIGTLKRATIDAQMKKSHTIIQTLNVFEQSIVALFENDNENADQGNTLTLDLILLPITGKVNNIYPARKAYYSFTTLNTS